NHNAINKSEVIRKKLARKLRGFRACYLSLHVNKVPTYFKKSISQFSSRAKTSTARCLNCASASRRVLLASFARSPLTNWANSEGLELLFAKSRAISLRYLYATVSEGRVGTRRETTMSGLLNRLSEEPAIDT